MVQAYVPVVAPLFGTFVATEVQVAPPSRLTSMLTDYVPRLWLHVMLWVLPTAQAATAVFGAGDAEPGPGS